MNMNTNMSTSTNTRIRYYKVLKSKDNKYMSLNHETGRYFWSDNIGDAACWKKMDNPLVI